MPALDSARQIATPEGCALTLRLAGPIVRSRAFFVDAALRGALLLAATQVLVFTGTFAPGLFGLLVFALEWFYPILFEVFWKGSTPGKRLCGLVVLQDDGTPIDWGTSFTRNTLRALDFLPFLYGVGLLTMLLGNGFQRIGDLAAGTVVVHRDDPEAPVMSDEKIAPFRSRYALQRDEQRTLIDFLRRAPLLTEERGEELALLTGPLVDGLSARAARERVLAIGRYLLGPDR
ncbi:MAG: RDD family protein [Burkholderiaceae bacterium]|jgi:uncharacterized RDD family membrane protein YckC